jgi:uncharacterized protein (TIGR00251 family)
MIDVKVIPKSSRNEVAGILPSGALKIKVAAAPEKGKANAQVCELLAEVFGVPKRNVQIVRGETSQIKRVSVHS